ncbi:hypothetical protein MMC16_000141 [Acarospora aff. strigata]|nr:hypothetical protein [Acarospora aff. strigata]
MRRSKSEQYGVRTPIKVPPDDLIRPVSSGSLNVHKTAHVLITTVLINNIHCASCVAYIKEVLQDLSLSIWNIEISVLLHQVRVRHTPNLTAAIICQSLNDASFEVYDATTTDTTGEKIAQVSFGDGSDGWLEQAAGYWRRSHLGSSTPSCVLSQMKKSRHIRNCEACRKEENVASANEEPPVSSTSKERQLIDAGLPSSTISPGQLSKVEETWLTQDESSTLHDVRSTPTKEERRPVTTNHKQDAEAVLQRNLSGQPFVALHPSGEGIINSGVTQATEKYTILLSIGGMTCASCTGAIIHSLEEMAFVNSVNVTLLTNSATATFTGPKETADIIVDKIEDLGYNASIERCWLNNARELHTASRVKDHKLKAVLSIGGMTCASCTGAVTRGLEELPFVHCVTIDLLSNSGTVIFTGEEHLREVVGKVEDLGYECTVQECVSGTDGSHEDDGGQQRSVKVMITGMFCEHCPPKIVEAIKLSCHGQFIVEKSPTLKNPIIEVSYTPQPPNLTIRHVFAAIHNLNDAFTASVYHPPTLEQRSRAMQLHEQRRLLYRLLLSFVTAIPTLLIGVVWMSLVSAIDTTRMYLEQPVWAGKVTRFEWALFILATPVMFFAADVFHVRALKEVRALWRRSSRVPILRRFYRFGSMNLLISAGTSVAYFASVALLIVDATTTTTMSGSGTTYFDTIVFLTFFILMGRFLEAYSKAKAGDAVAMLGKLRPSQALLVSSSHVSIHDSKGNQVTIDQSAASTSPDKVDVDLLESGDMVLIPQGVSPPADGLVVAGQSQFDESSLTGESRPVTKIVGDKVYAGSINIGKPVTVRLTEVNGTSMLDQIVSVVREGQTRRAPVERVADVLTGYFVPLITLLAILTFIIWFSLGQSGILPEDYLDTDQGGWAFWSLEFAIAVFVVACPCGIGLAAPTAMFVGSGLAAKHGILVRGGGEAFQETSNLDVVVFDKTGTLTEGGSLSVTDYDVVASDDKATMVWAVAKALEGCSEHPIAKAIVDFCEGKEQCPVQSADIEEIPGHGLRGTFSLATSNLDYRFEAAIGNETFMASLGVDTGSYFSTANLSKWKTEGKSVALLAMREIQETASSFSLAAQFATTDPIRPEAAQVVRRIQEAGLGVYMLSGDNPTTASSVGQAIGIPASNIIAGVLPTEKADKIRWLQANASKRRSTKPSSIHDARRKTNVAFVGDGINDAPALTAATVSIAIGSGSDIALSSSSFILLTSNLLTLLTLLDLSKTVFRRIKFNFAWALVYNVCLLPIAAGVIYPAAGHPRLGPVWASAAMAASSVSVVLSSLALRLRVPGLGFREAR